MEKFKKYITEIIWAFLATIIEIATIAVCLTLITMLPHGLTFLSFGFFQWLIIVTLYRLITYKFNKTQSTMSNSEDIQSNVVDVDIPPAFSSVAYDDERPQTQPIKNVFTHSEMEKMNNDSAEYSVRE